MVHCVLHSSALKSERKYLSAAKSSFFKGIIINVITNIFITSPDYWDTWLLGSRTDL
jgi:hypothetical protein